MFRAALLSIVLAACTAPILVDHEPGDSAVDAGCDGACMPDGHTAACAAQHECDGGPVPCERGYQRNGSDVCSDVNECAAPGDPCPPRTKCMNTQGSYECATCPDGYQGDPNVACSDVDECKKKDACDALTTCTNMPAGSFSCSSCPPGYEGDGKTGCQEVNECEPNPCEAVYACLDGALAYRCSGQLVDWEVPEAMGPYQATELTIRDQSTGLEWQRKVADQPYTQADAKAHCTGLTLGTLTDWRLPTKVELESIVHFGRATPAIDPIFPSTPNEAFWTASQAFVDDAATVHGFQVEFANGSSRSEPEATPSRVRCVRGVAP